MNGGRPGTPSRRRGRAVRIHQSKQQRGQRHDGEPRVRRTGCLLHNLVRRRIQRREPPLEQRERTDERRSHTPFSVLDSFTTGTAAA